MLAGGTVTWVWPAAIPPCNRTLQACVDVASSGDTVEIHTDDPIYEGTLSFAKSLTLRAAPGFAPFIGGDEQGRFYLGATTPSSGNHLIRIEGLLINKGTIDVSPVTTGTTAIEIVNNGFEFVNSRGIRVSATEANGPISVLIEGNEIDPLAGETSIGIGITGGSFPVNARIANNRIVMQGGYQQEAIYVQHAAATSSIDVIANEIVGTGYDYGIEARQVALGNLTFRVLDNIVTGAAQEDGFATAIYAYSGVPSTLDVTIVNNTVANNDTGISVGGPTATVTGRVVNNAITGNGRGLNVDPDGGTLVTDRSNLFFGNDVDLGDGESVVLPGPNTLFADPHYSFPGNFYPAAGSPLIDAGRTSSVPLDLLTDIEGSPRIVGGMVDIGAYEVPEAQTLFAGASALAALVLLWARPSRSDR